MDLFNKITIAHFIWYLVPGLALVFFLLFPFLILNPHLAYLIFKNLNPLGVILLGIVLGFSLDGLRLYRFRPNYKKTKDAFFMNLKEAINIELDPYFIQAQVSDVAKQKKVTGIGIHHAIWIMHGHLAILAFLECAFWGVTTLYILIWGDYPFYFMTIAGESRWLMASLYATLGGLFFLIGLRFHLVSMEDQNTTNTMFLNFAKQYRKEIQTLLNMTTES